MLTRKYFKSIVGAGEAASDKPSSKPVDMAIERASILPNEINRVWFIGDSQTDIDCAKNLSSKTHSIIIGDQKTVKEDVRFKSLSKLNDFILKIS